METSAHQALRYKEEPVREERPLGPPSSSVVPMERALCLMNLDLLHSGENPCVPCFVITLSGLALVSGEGTCSGLPFLDCQQSL